MMPWYAVADVFVLPTHSDAWGLTVNEAMMFGVPVITTKQAGCSSELIDGNGFVVESGDRSAMKRSLERILVDDELRYKMGLRSREVIGKYSIENAKKTFMCAVSKTFHSTPGGC